MSDIFGGSTCKEDDSLYGCESVSCYNRKLLQLKSKWLKIEREHTTNRPANQFVQYFEAHKEKQIREKMIKGVRKQASIYGTYGQNPIEWQNYLAKDEISACIHSGRSHRDATISEALDALKARSIRLYSNVVKALYDDGPYVLSPAYSMFRKTYAEWQSMSPENRKEHVSEFFGYIPTDDVILRVGVNGSVSSTPAGGSREEVNISTCCSSRQEHGPDQIQPTTTTKHDVPFTSRQLINRSLHTTSNQTEVITGSTDIEEVAKDIQRRKLSVSFQEASVLEDIIPPQLLQDAFCKAEELLNEPNFITKAATDDDRLRTVKSRYGSVPLIVKPLPKNRDLFECTCKVYKALGMCCDTIAVAEEVGVLCNYLCELRKKLGKRKKRGKSVVDITAAIQSDLSTSLKGHKKNEIKKISRRRRRSSQQESIGEDLVQTSAPASPHNSLPTESPSHYIVQQPSWSCSQASSNNTQCFPTGPERTLFHPTFQSANTNLHTGPHSSRMPESRDFQHMSYTTQYNRVTSVTPQHTGQPSTPVLTSNFNQACSRIGIHSLQQLHAGYVNAGSANQLSATGSSTFNNTSHQQSNAQTNMFDAWNSSMSPHRYELVLLPNSVTKCYGCHQEFTNACRAPPNNMVVKHMDRRITGRDQSGQLIYSPDFRATYYHPIKEHIMLKNPLFNGRVFIAPVLAQMLTPEHSHVINNVLNLSFDYM